MNFKLSGFSVCILLILSGCSPGSQMVQDDNRKMNGGFEIVKENLPVNWYFYSPETVAEGDFDIIVDTVHFKEGKQSLKFLVRKCSSIGGRLSPGFFGSFITQPDETYTISFWMMNKGCNVLIRVGSQGDRASQTREETILKTADTISEWKYIEYSYTMPSLDNIRFEVNILASGSFWIDNIKIEGINDKSEMTRWGR